MLYLFLSFIFTRNKEKENETAKEIIYKEITYKETMGIASIPYCWLVQKLTRALCYNISGKSSPSDL